MDLDTSSHFFIGGFPDDFSPQKELRTSSFSGCLFEVLLDGKPVGLWNFKSSIGCDGCKEGATEDIDVSASEFQGGSSYAIVPQIAFYKKSEFYASLSFKTLNEDGLLFLSTNNLKGHMMSIELIGGKVIYQIKFDDRTQIRLETKKKYNTGQWIYVVAVRENFIAELSVEEEELKERGVRGSSSALDLKDSSLYYGGVPPNFTEERWPGVTFTNFFGCMKDLQIDSTPIDLFRGSFFAMNAGCSNRPMKVATFKGTGYLELNGQSLPIDSSFSFSFMTYQKDALLLLSTFSSQESKSQELMQTYYSIALKDGKIIAMLNNGGGEIRMSSDRVIGSGIFHTVNVIRKNRRLLLRLDDEEQADLRLGKGAKEISSPEKGGLFFGGVKKSISVGSMAASQQPFIGIIQDAVFNDKLLRFEDTVSHKGVDFGIPDMKSVSDEVFQQMAPSIPGESCVSDLVIDDNAVSLQSRKPTEIFLNKKDVKNNFNISVDYRTFYPDGNIIYLSNEPKKLHFSVYLEKGLVKVDYLRKKDHKTDKSVKELTIGKWHKVEILKHGKHLTVFLDRKKSILMQVPKRLPFRNIYIGGVSLINNAPRELQSNFKGCFRNLFVNEKSRKIPSESSCFEHVDFGTYFTGMGYVTQDAAFHLGKQLDLNLQFRTSQLDGIILSIFSRFSGVWFELCLQDNMILATLYEHDNLNLQLSQNLKLDGSCDYMWHKVEMFYRNGTFTLHIDNLKPVEQKVKNIPKDFGFAEVYLGGKPGKHIHAGECGNSYSGCVRGITLNRESLHVKNPETEEDIVQYMCPQL